MLTGQGTDILATIESANLTGGESGNILDASAFTLGAVTLSGGAGADTLTGGSGDDSLDGGADTDIVKQTLNVDQTLTDSSVTGAGTDSLANVETANLIGQGGDNTLNASAFTLGTVTLSGGAGADSLYGGSGDDSLDGGAGDDTIIQSGDINQTLTDASLTGKGTDTLASIENATLTGGDSANTIDASAFTGSVNLTGGLEADVLTGGTGADTLTGGAGADILTGGGGADVIDGGADDDRWP